MFRIVNPEPPQEIQNINLGRLRPLTLYQSQQPRDSQVSTSFEFFIDLFDCLMSHWPRLAFSKDPLVVKVVDELGVLALTDFTLLELIEDFKKYFLWDVEVG
jgi:hypothetical protein